MADRVRLDHAAIAELLTSTDGPVGKHLTKIAIRVERGAKQRAPVDTGRLRSSVTWELDSEGRFLVARIGTNVVYAKYQELGTARMPAHPFLRPALDSVRGGP